MKKHFNVLLLFSFLAALTACNSSSSSGSAASTNNNPTGMTSINTSIGRFNPLFSADVTTYEIGINQHGVTSIDITAVFEANHTVKINDSTATSGQPTSVALDYSTTSFTIPIEITDPNSVKYIYTLNINKRTLSTNSTLQNITPSVGTLSPNFNGSVTSYTLTIPNTEKSFTLKPTAAEAVQWAYVNSTLVTNNTNSSAIGINPAGQAVTVQGSAENGTTTSYTINVQYDQCPAGYYLASGACTEVGIGYFSTGANDRNSCSNKPSNSSYTSSVANSSDCPWSCDNGYLTTDGSACTSFANAEVLKCNTGEIAVGLSGRSGAIIDKISLRCATISGTVITGSSTDGASYGGSGGFPFNEDGSYDCPSGSALYEIDGNLGIFSGVNRTGKLRYRCKNLASGEVSTWKPSDSTYWGQYQERSAYNFKCGTSPNLYGSYINGLVIDNASNTSYVGDILGISCR